MSVSGLISEYNDEDIGNIKYLDNDGCIEDIDDNIIVIEFTGLTDMDNKDIFESDRYIKDGHKGTIVFEDGCFWAMDDRDDDEGNYKEPLFDGVNKQLIIMGNTFEDKGIIYDGVTK